MMKSWMAGLLLALLYSFVSLIQERPIHLADHNKDNEHNNDDKPVYNIVPLQTPVVTGIWLQAFAWLASRSVLGPFILRHLFDQNAIDSIRRLAAQELQARRVTHPTYFPAHYYHQQQQQQQEQQQSQQSQVNWTDPSALLRDVDFWQRQFPPPNSGSSVPPYYSTLDYHKLYSSQTATPSKVLERVFQAIQDWDPTLKFMAYHADDESVRQQAQESDARFQNQQPRSVLDGVPVLLKDMLYVPNVPIMCDGTRDACVANHQNEEDYVVTALRQAGAIIVGTTVSTEGGVSPLGYNAWWDGPHNPHDLHYYCGGSSSGSAVAVAAGIVPLAIGIDGGGSIRVPASMSGIVGLAPTFGRVPTRRGGFSVTKTGPMTATMLDVAVAHLVLSQVQPETWHHRTMLAGLVPDPMLVLDESDKGTQEQLQQQQQSPLKGYRLGVFWDHFVDSDPEVVEASWKAVETLQNLGAHVVNVTIPHLRELHLAHGVKILSEFAIAWDGAFHKTNVTLEANTQIMIAMGKALSATEAMAAEYVRTYGIHVVCRDIFRDQSIDAIVSPMLGLKVPKPTHGYRGYGESNTALVYQTMRYVPLANLLGLPGLSIPVGYEEDTGLPIGFQLLGDAWSEHKLIHLAKYLEAEMPRRRPPHFADVLAPFLSPESEETTDQS